MSTYITWAKLPHWSLVAESKHHNPQTSRQTAEEIHPNAQAFRTVLHEFTNIPTCSCHECQATALSIMQAALTPLGGYTP